MRPVAVRILHPQPGPAPARSNAGSGRARARLAERHRRGFAAAGATDVRVVSSAARRYTVRPRGSAGSSGPSDRTGWSSWAPARSRSRPGATGATWSAPPGPATRRALANNRYSADVVAIASATEALAAVPDELGDNALPRWLAEVPGWSVDDLRRRWRLGVDIDGPLDLLLAGDADGSRPRRRRRSTRAASATGSTRSGPSRPTGAPSC